MPQLQRWDNLPDGVRQHLVERMRDRAISVSDLNQLRLWVETRPEVPTVTGTRISALLKSAAADHTPKPSRSEGKLQRVKPSDQSASADSSSVVACRLLISRLLSITCFWGNSTRNAQG
jgi:hypothetical protein